MSVKMSSAGAAAHVKGSTIQIIALLFLVLQNVVGPKLFGAELFGKTFYLLSFILVLQGILESVFFALTIQKLSDEKPRPGLGRMWRDGALFACVYLAATSLFLISRGFVDVLPLLLIISALQFATTLVTALAYGAQRLRSVFIANAGALLAFAMVLFVSLLWFKEVGLISAFLAYQIAQLSLLLRDVELRRLISRHRILEERQTAVYGSALLTRAPVLLFGNGLIIGIGLLGNFAAVAVVKVFLSMINAGRFMLPLSMPVLQSVSAKERFSQVDSTKVLLVVAAVIWSVFGAAFFFLAPVFVDEYLGLDAMSQPLLAWMFAAMPAYLLMQPLALYAFSKNMRVAISVVFVLGVLAGLGGLLTYGIIAGFATAAWVYSLSLATIVYRQPTKNLTNST